MSLFQQPASLDSDSLGPISDWLFAFNNPFKQGIGDIRKFRGIVFEGAVFDRT
jgi:hypothetical protein